ncbi:Anaerobic dimethyl sulfoxide reductase chain A [Candidatus Paraburkholderia schumanniana]|nr:Anaerobic dimethyl sulfoxide reductase chain A [Candidatus Paraburkholderia schumannianae]
MAVGSVVLFGTLSMFLYPLALNAGWLHLDTLGAGLFFGGTIHEVAQVVGAASNVSPEATHIATIVKMTRVMLLVPVLLVIGFWISRARGEASAQGKGKIAVPWFALGFLALVVVNSLHVLPDVATATINTLDTFALTMAMTALGMETRIVQIREAGPRTIATGAILYAWLIGGGLAITLGVERLFG